MKRTDNRLMVLQTNDKRAKESECEKKTQKTTIKKKKTSPKKKKKEKGKERKEGSNTKERRFTGPTQTRVRKREGR